MNLSSTAGSFSYSFVAPEWHCGFLSRLSRGDHPAGSSGAEEVVIQADRREEKWETRCVRQRLKRQGLRRIHLPTIMLGNVQSLPNKVDELQANVKFLEEYKGECVLAVTETWLKDRDAQSDLKIDGFGLVTWGWLGSVN